MATTQTPPFTHRIGRIPIRQLSPQQPENRWPSTAFVGEVVPFAATVFREGHDLIGAEIVITMPDGAVERHALEQRVAGTDRWQADVQLLQPGTHRWHVEAYADDWGTWLHAATVKIAAGVDVELRQQLWAYVRELNDQGVTIVLTTHYLEEAEELCDRIAIINHGRLIANEPTRALVNKAQEKIVEVTVDRDLATPPQASCFEKSTLKGERVVQITYSKNKVNAGDVLSAVQAAGLGIVDVSTKEADLEDVFLSLTRSA